MVSPPVAVPPSVARRRWLREQVAGYWAAEIWDLRDCPLGHRRGHTSRYVRFACASEALNTELKFAVWQTVARGEWTLDTLAVQASHVRLIAEWANQEATGLSSIVEYPLDWCVASFRAFLRERGTLRAGTRRALNRRQELVEYPIDDKRIFTLRRLYRVIADAYDERPEHEKDRWDLRKLGIPLNLSVSTEYWLDFAVIPQSWLRAPAMRFVRYYLGQYSSSICRHIIDAVAAFGRFLERQYPELRPPDLARAHLVAYLGARPPELKTATWHRKLVNLRTFLEGCAREGWGGFPQRRLLFDDDFPRSEKREPRFIPALVVEQLNRHVDALPVPMMRMVLILEAVGMRIGELCCAPFDCLRRDGDGDTWLRYYQSKQKKEHSVPITPEVAAVIREQQADVAATHGTSPFLFPNRHSAQRPVMQENFRERLNAVAHQFAIRDETGRLFRFETHQFRHTVGTRMINQGFPQHIVQRYLGHESPHMTAVYAHLHDQTLKREFQRFARDQVDVTGRAGALDDPAFDADDLQWFKRHLHAQALPHGTCWLPATKGACPHANACFTCAHWRTDPRYLPVLREQLAQTGGLLAKARANGWTRQLEMNEQVERNLATVIVKLEDIARAKRR